MSRVLLLCAAISADLVLGGSPAMAWDPVKDMTGKPLHEHGEKLATEVGNALSDTAREAERLGKKTVNEIGNAGEDLRILVEEGKCGGDLCDAIDAAVKYTEANVIDTGDAIADAAKRLKEGKILDAWWHLAVDPLNDQQENAAEAAARSSVLRAVGQVAAGAYFGPGGAAAYAAWLTYNMTDGDLELALRAGAIAGATAAAMSSISDVQGIDAIKGVSIDEIAQRAALSGAVAGLAVAASGGDEAAIQNAVTAGLVMAVIRDGYKELTTTNLEDNLKASTGEPYCLAADPDSGLPCLPPREAYLRNPDGSIQYRRGSPFDPPGGSPRVDVTKLDAQRPHVGMFAKTAGDGGIMTESTEFMQKFSKIPGMNAMAVGHDIADSQFNLIGDIPVAQDAFLTIEMAVRIGTIAPSVVLTYEGAGYRVQEMIRKETASARRERDASGTVASADAAKPEGADTPDVSTAAAALGNGVAPDGPIFEIRNLACVGPSSSTAALLEMHLDLAAAGDGGRICSVNQALNEGWHHLWHAHNDASTCIVRFNALATRALARGERCYFSTGLRYGAPQPLDLPMQAVR